MNEQCVIVPGKNPGDPLSVRHSRTCVTPDWCQTSYQLDQLQRRAGRIKAMREQIEER